MCRSPCTKRLRVVWRSVIGVVPFTLGRMAATDVATDVMSWPVRKLAEAAMCAVAVGGVFAGFTKPDVKDALAALADVIAGPQGASDTGLADRADQLASDIMGMHGEVRGQRPADGPPAGGD